jgi:ubiquinone/menaquinone biosynthesis C-methylase UbiE
VPFQGIHLPPRQLGWFSNFTPAEYHASAKALVVKAVEQSGLSADDRILDIGCGPGRFLIGLQATFGEVRQYLGVDVRKQVIEWANRYLADSSGRVAFEWLNLANERYNPGGERMVGERIVPVDDHGFDFVYLYSVFTHMRLEDIDRYLVEIERVMAPGGRTNVTAFVEEGVPDWEENPDGYIQKWKRPLHCARMNRSTFESMIAAADLKVDTRLHRPNAMSTYVLSSR